MAKIVEAKSLYGGMLQEHDLEEDDTVMQITIYLDLLDMIDHCLNEFKAKYLSLHQERLQ